MKQIFYSLVFIGVDIVVLINVFMFFDIAFQPFNQEVMYWDFNNYYFGYKSIIEWIKDCPEDLNINTFFGFLRDLIITTTGLDIANIESFNVIEVIKAMLFGPLMLFFHICNTFTKLVSLLYQSIVWIYELFSGKYNIPLNTLPVSDISVDTEFLDPNWWSENSRCIVPIVNGWHFLRNLL